jgi:hypothetical protein
MQSIEGNINTELNNAVVSREKKPNDAIVIYHTKLRFNAFVSKVSSIAVGTIGSLGLQTWLGMGSGVIDSFIGSTTSIFKSSCGSTT